MKWGQRAPTRHAGAGTTHSKGVNRPYQSDTHTRTHMRTHPTARPRQPHSSHGAAAPSTAVPVALTLSRTRRTKQPLKRCGPIAFTDQWLSSPFKACRGFKTTRRTAKNPTAILSTAVTTTNYLICQQPWDWHCFPHPPTHSAITSRHNGQQAGVGTQKGTSSRPQDGRHAPITRSARKHVFNAAHMSIATLISPTMPRVPAVGVASMRAFPARQSAGKHRVRRCSLASLEAEQHTQLKSLGNTTTQPMQATQAAPAHALPRSRGGKDTPTQQGSVLGNMQAAAQPRSL